MFTWICPKCGREVPPSYDECPDCSVKVAEPTSQPPQNAATPPESSRASASPASPPEYPPATAVCDAVGITSGCTPAGLWLSAPRAARPATVADDDHLPVCIRRAGVRHLLRHCLHARPHVGRSVHHRGEPRGQAGHED